MKQGFSVAEIDRHRSDRLSSKCYAACELRFTRLIAAERAAVAVVAAAAVAVSALANASPMDMALREDDDVEEDKVCLCDLL